MSDAHKYDNPVQPDNKFGHSLGLLARHLPIDAAGAVHLDIACGFGHVAEHVIASHGVEYVGVDVDEDALLALRDRGHEAHLVDLQADTVLDMLTKVMDGRRLGSVTFLDGLEHLTNGTHVLAAIAALLAEHRAVAVFSVPNVTHVDVGIKNLLGTWDYTEAGLLDGTHYQLWSHDSLTAALQRAGLSKIDAHDVVLARSDQHFPVDHVALSETSVVGRYLRYLRSLSDPHAITNQFVWAVSAVPVPAGVVDTEPAPFLTVLMRTQGRREQELREALLSLAGQTDRDFEVILVAHRTTWDQQHAIERLVEDQPLSLRSRIRLLLLDHGERSAPLNLALDHARGDYVVILDDDDITLAHWVEEFHRAAAASPRRVLRAICVSQDVDLADVRGFPGVRARSAPQARWAPEFSFLTHLLENSSPPSSWAYPRSLARDFGVRYDESFTTTEDYDVLLQVAEIAGVSDVPEVTSIYHQWLGRESSRTIHNDDDWVANAREIERRVDRRPVLLPPGEARTVRTAITRTRQLEAETARLEVEIRGLVADIGERDTLVHHLNLAVDDRDRRLEQQKARVVDLRYRLRRLRDRTGPVDNQAEAPVVTAGLVRRVRGRVRARTRLRRLLRH